MVSKTKIKLYNKITVALGQAVSDIIGELESEHNFIILVLPANNNKGYNAVISNIDGDELVTALKAKTTECESFLIKDSNQSEVIH